MNTVRGLHHVTAIAGPAQENLDFYAGVLGMRLVKKSVNQDDPGTYHLFYADAEGHPGTDLTFFPWAQMAPSRDGYGLSTEVSLAVPPGSLVFWSARLQRYGVPLANAEVRFGEHVLPMRDPHGLRVALVESQDSLGRPSRHGTKVRSRSNIRFADWKARACRKRSWPNDWFSRARRWDSDTSARKASGIVTESVTENPAAMSMCAKCRGATRRVGHGQHSSYRLAGG